MFAPLDFEEAIEYLRTRTPVTRARWDALDSDARKRAFTVSRVGGLDEVQGIFDSINTALANGESFESFKQRTVERLGSAPGHLENVYRTNVMSAYGAGRYEVYTTPDTREARPMLMFSAIMDEATTEICRPLDGIIKPIGDSFWETHTPGLHFQCRSDVITLDEDQTADMGGVTGRIPEHNDPLEGFGGLPDLGALTIDRGDYDADVLSAAGE